MLYFTGRIGQSKNINDAGNDQIVRKLFIIYCDYIQMGKLTYKWN